MAKDKRIKRLEKVVAGAQVEKINLSEIEKTLQSENYVGKSEALAEILQRLKQIEDPNYKIRGMISNISSVLEAIQPLGKEALEYCKVANGEVVKVSVNTVKEKVEKILSSGENDKAVARLARKIVKYDKITRDSLIESMEEAYCFERSIIDPLGETLYSLLEDRNIGPRGLERILDIIDNLKGYQGRIMLKNSKEAVKELGYNGYEKFSHEINWFNGVSWGEEITTALAKKGLEIKRKLSEKEWGKFIYFLMEGDGELKENEFECVKYSIKEFESKPWRYSRAWSYGRKIVEKAPSIIDKVGYKGLMKISKIVGFLFEQDYGKEALDRFVDESENEGYDVRKADGIAIKILQNN